MIFNIASFLVPMEMSEWSMAPWLIPGDVLLVARHNHVSELKKGEVVVLRHRIFNHRLVHRIVSTKQMSENILFCTKGDRNSATDPLDDHWILEGRVERRYRNHRWTALRWRRILWFLSICQLYPGQRLPFWMTRTNLKQALWL